MQTLKISTTASAKIQALQQKNDQLVLDLDDGIGVFSQRLLENGLKYRLLLVPADQVPADFNLTIQTNAGVVKFNAETARCLDEHMQIDVRPVNGTLQLSSDNTLLEPDMPLRRAVPQTTVSLQK